METPKPPLSINWNKLTLYLKKTTGNYFIYHTSNNNWGGSILCMEKNGKAFARTYWFYDDDKSIYFDWLSVTEEYRKNGIATKLLNSHIKTAQKFKIETFLWVERDSWMYEWYKDILSIKNILIKKIQYG